MIDPLHPAWWYNTLGFAGLTVVRLNPDRRDPTGRDGNVAASTEAADVDTGGPGGADLTLSEGMVQDQSSIKDAGSNAYLNIPPTYRPSRPPPTQAPAA